MVQFISRHETVIFALAVFAAPARSLLGGGHTYLHAFAHPNMHAVKVQLHASPLGLAQRYNACQDASLRVLRESILAESFFKQTKQLLLLTTDLGLLAFGKPLRVCLQTHACSAKAPRTAEERAL